MRHGMNIPLLLLLGTPLVVGCAGVRSERVSYRSYGDAFRIYNSEVELIVVPATGRIMHYGFRADGVNRLWENPESIDAMSEGTWHNWGGDKVWVWPQDDWPRIAGRRWPPPGDPPAAPYRVEPIAGGVRLTSPPIGEYGLRIVREIRLPSPDTTRVEIVSWFEPVQDAPPIDTAVAVWTVTQVPPPEWIIAHCVGEASAYRTTNPSPFDVKRAGDNELCLTRDAGLSGKIGLDADRLAASYRDVIFEQRVRPSRAQTDAIQPGEGAQLFSEPASPSPYVELEFTGPMHQPAEQPSPLRVTWELTKRKRQ
jgi:hypothetical protein